MRRRGPVPALAALALALNLYGIGWGLPHHVDWAADSIAPLGPLRYVRTLLDGEAWWSKYPPFHYTVLAAAYAPYVAFELAADRLALRDTATYPFGFRDPETSLGRLTLIARLVSALMGVGLVLLVHAMTRDLFGARAAVFAALAVTFSPLALYYAHNANLDVPYVFWAALAVWMAVRLARAPRRRDAALLGVAAALAVATKDQAYGLFAVLPVVLVGLARGDGRSLLEALRDRSLLVAGGAFVATYAVASHVIVNPDGWLEHVRWILGPGSERRGDHGSPVALAGFALASVRMLAVSLTPPMLLAALAGVGLALARRTGRLPLAFALSYALTFVLVILAPRPRVFLPLVALAAPYAGLALAEAWARAGRAGRALALGVVLAAAAYGVSFDLEFGRDARYAAEAWIHANVPPGAVIGSDASPVYLPRLPSSVRVRAVTLHGPQSVAAGPAAPHFLVLTSAEYRKLRGEPREAFRRLLAGARGYRKVAEFSRRVFIGPRHFIRSLNPDIVILARS